MLNLPENELFSGYIDGELTAEEQAQVEEILSSSPEARQLVDDLRSLSQSLQALPAYQLDHGLAESVLRRAEREMLSQPASPLPKFHQVEPLPMERPSWAARLLRPRNFAWSAIAIAVAVFLMMTESDKSGKPGNPPGGLAGSQGSDMLIEPAGNDLVVEAVEQPRPETSKPTAVASAVPDGQVPDAAPPGSLPPKPEAIAGDQPKPAVAVPEPAGPKDEPKAAPLLVYECRPVEGLVGAEALAEAFKQCGVALDGSIQIENGGGLEVQLTPEQIARVVAHLQSNKQRFSEVASVSTAKHAGPRIPSAVRSEGPRGAAANLAADAATAETPGKIKVQFEGQITIQPKTAPVKTPAETETTGMGDGGPPPPGSSKPAAVGLGPGPENLPVYRVRFLFKPAAKPKNDAP